MSDTLNLTDTFWPNGLKEDSEGYAIVYPIGSNKIQVPTINWPEGDTLISPFVYKNEKLVGFVDTKAMTVNSPTTIELPYKHIEAKFTSIDEGTLTVIAPNAIFEKYIWKNSTTGGTVAFKYKGCTTVDEVKAVDPNYKTNDIVDGVWTERLDDLVDGNPNNYYASGMFYDCTALTTFNSDLSSLTDGSYLFGRCTNLTTFNTPMKKLLDGKYMFGYCESLSEFTSDLSSLINGEGMFSDSPNIINFDAPMPKITNLDGVFASRERWQHNIKTITIKSNFSSVTFGKCTFELYTNLVSFNANLSSLTNGHRMFYNCTALSSFNSDLSSLTDGSYMFFGCSLDTTSVQNIADTINTPSDKGIIHVDYKSWIPDGDVEEAFNTIASRNWTVYANGKTYTQSSPAAITTLDENGEEIIRPIPYYAKPIPATEETAEYIDSEGNYYNVLGAQFIYGDDLSTYGMFTCFDDAVANMRLTKIERN